jgi:hypothetical protein
MALSKIDAANFLTGTIPDTNINNASLDNVTTLPAAIATGKVLQVVTATDSTQRSTTSTSFTLGGSTLTVDITPSSTSSKVYVVCTFTGYPNNTSSNAYFTIYRDATHLGTGSGGFITTWSETGRVIGNPMAISVLDSPSSTSTLTYQMRWAAQSGGTTYLTYDGTKSVITAFEIAG